MPIEANKIYCESNIDTMKRMPANFIDLVVTSPPYDNLRDYNGYSFPFEEIAQELFRVVKIGGVVVWVVGDATINGSETGTSFKQALFFMQCGFNLLDTMIYCVNGTGAKGSNFAYWQSFEYMFILTKGNPKSVNRIADKPNANAGKLRNATGSKKLNKVGTRTERKGVEAPAFSVRPNVWLYNVGQNDITEHPAVFPEQLAADHIYSWSNAGDLVYDPFMGSGTTGKMAMLMDRNYIGSEMSSEYVAIAEKRIALHKSQGKLF